MYKLSLMLFLAYTANCQSTNVWRGITPLKSTREDVEKLLGKPAPGSVAEHAAEYITKEGKVFVSYSTGSCGVNPANGWNVPESTVIRIDFDPNYPNPYKFSKFKINRNKFERRPDPGSIELVFYTNETDGIVLTIDTSDDSVRSFGYFPESKNNYLMCKNM